LTTWLSPVFPSSLKYFDINNSPLTNIPSAIPAGLLYINVATCSLGPTEIGNIGSGLDANGLNNGYFAFRNNPSSGSAPFVGTWLPSLVGKGWTVVS
jgi:hypothetical protein